MLQNNEATLLAQWLDRIKSEGGRVAQFLTPGEQERYASQILKQLLKALESGNFQKIDGSDFAIVRSVLTDMSANFVERGLTPSETATFIFSLKEVLFSFYKTLFSGEELSTKTWELSTLIDQLGLFTFESYALARERVIKSQAQSLAELSTPVIKVWDGIVALPLVGMIDSARAKEVMENLLDAIITHSADVAIIDITGVPVVDTQVANRLMRTVEAVRLLGTRSIITGINPIIAQTLVQLGVDLGQLSTKSSLHAGLAQAFREMKLKVVPAATVAK